MLKVFLLSQNRYVICVSLCPEGSPLPRNHSVNDLRPFKLWPSFFVTSKGLRLFSVYKPMSVIGGYAVLVFFYYDEGQSPAVLIKGSFLAAPRHPFPH